MGLLGVDEGNTILVLVGFRVRERERVSNYLRVPKTRFSHERERERGALFLEYILILLFILFILIHQLSLVHLDFSK